MNDVSILIIIIIGGFIITILRLLRLRRHGAKMANESSVSLKNEEHIKEQRRRNQALVYVLIFLTIGIILLTIIYAVRDIFR